jgi:hypothetical protein
LLPPFTLCAHSATSGGGMSAGSAGEVAPVAWASPNFVPETNDGRSQEEEVEVEVP